MKRLTAGRRLRLLLCACCLLLAGCGGTICAHAGARTYTTACTVRDRPRPATTGPPRVGAPPRPKHRVWTRQKLMLMLETIIPKQKLKLHSLLVIRNGYIVSKTYFQSYTGSRPNIMKAVFLSRRVSSPPWWALPAIEEISSRSGNRCSAPPRPRVREREPAKGQR